MNEQTIRIGRYRIKSTPVGTQQHPIQEPSDEVFNCDKGAEWRGVRWDTVVSRVIDGEGGSKTCSKPRF